MEIKTIKGEHARQTHEYAVRSAVNNALRDLAERSHPWKDSFPIPAKIEIEVKSLEGQYVAYLTVTETINPDEVPS